MFTKLRKDEPVTIRFLFDGEQVSYKDIKLIWKIQERSASPEDIQILMAHFMVDAAGRYLDEDKAIAALDKLKGKEIAEVQTRFIEALQENSIPKASASGSNSPSDPGPAPMFPNGSEL